MKPTVEPGTAVWPHQGLTDAAVAASRAEHGANVLTPPAKEPWWRSLLEKFSDPVIRILLIAAALAILCRRCLTINQRRYRTRETR